MLFLLLLMLLLLQCCDDGVDVDVVVGVVADVRVVLAVDCGVVFH